MSVTVADCLKLPALREAKLLAGVGGLYRLVASVSVIEHPDKDALSDTLLVGNELIISALVQIKDDVDAQCSLLRHLHMRGEACLILYYVGIYITEVDERLLKTADDLGFPLIVMPANRMDFRYSDVMMEVAELVIMQQKREKYYVSEMVNRISQFSAQYCTLATALRLLSDRIRCTLLLADRSFIYKGAAAWPASNQWNYTELLETMRDRNFSGDKPIVEVMQGKKATIWRLPISVKKKHIYHLFILDEQAVQENESIGQAAEVVEIFLNIWSKEAIYEQTDALVHAILNDDPAAMYQLAKSMHIDIENIHTIWFLHILTENGKELQDRQLLGYATQCKGFMQECHKTVFADVYGKYLAVFADDNIFEESEISRMQEFIIQLKGEGLVAYGVVCPHTENPSQARMAFLLTKENLSAACAIYKSKVAFTLGELRFAQSCGVILARGEAATDAAIACLDMLRTLDDYVELTQTLCVFLLDADSNVAKTGAILFLHRNSVQHRLNKIKRVLGSDWMQMPELFQVYQACALFRLLGR